LVTFGDTLAVHVNKTEFKAVAVSVAVSLLEILPAVAVNVVEVAPAATVTEAAETGSQILLLESETWVPPAGAAPLKVTVQVVVEPEVKLLGEQRSWETETTCPKAASGDKMTAIAATTALPAILDLLTKRPTDAPNYHEILTLRCQFKKINCLDQSQIALSRNSRNRSTRHSSMGFCGLDIGNFPSDKEFARFLQ
jgi:hypothetical protein